MNVGRTDVDGVEHDLLQIAHHRCIVDFDAAGILLRSRCAFFVEEIQIEVFGVQHSHRVVVRFAHLFDQLAELVVLHHHRFHRLPGLEFHLVQRLQMRGVGRRHIQLVAPLIQGKHPPFLHQFRIEQPLRQALMIHGIQVQIGETERGSRKLGNLIRLEPPPFDQFGHERIARLAGTFPDALSVVLGQPAMVDHGTCQSG